MSSPKPIRSEVGFATSVQVDHRADIFSLGFVLYEMLTGELSPGRFPPPSRKAEIDFRLDEVGLRALEKESNQRYPRATEVRGDVESIRDHPTGSRIENRFSFRARKAKTLFEEWNRCSSPTDDNAELLTREDLETRLGIPATALTIAGALGTFVRLLLMNFEPHLYSLTTFVGAGLSLKHLQNFRVSIGPTAYALLATSPLLFPLLIALLLTQSESVNYWTPFVPAFSSITASNR